VTLLSLRGVTVSFDGRHRVRGVDLDVARGENVGLVGAAGAGKTTIGRVAAGLVRPSAGEVALDGDVLSHRRTRAQRRRIQLTFQNARGSFDPRRSVGSAVSDGLALAGIAVPSRRDRVGHLFADVGLDPELARRLPQQLSGGQVQRAALARALACAPDILICDEITSSLDVSARAGVLNLLSRLGRSHGLTLLMISHDEDVVTHLCDRTVTIVDGRITP
jgi:peptide/nickel transport system ATP-binding protein